MTDPPRTTPELIAAVGAARAKIQAATAELSGHNDALCEDIKQNGGVYTGPDEDGTITAIEFDPAVQLLTFKTLRSANPVPEPTPTPTPTPLPAPAPPSGMTP